MGHALVLSHPREKSSSHFLGLGDQHHHGPLESMGRRGVSFASHGNIWEWLQIPWFCGLPPTCCPDRDTLNSGSSPSLSSAGHPSHLAPWTEEPLWWTVASVARPAPPAKKQQARCLGWNCSLGTSLSNHSTLLRVGPIEGSSPQRCASRVAKPSGEGGIDSGEPPHSVGRPACPLPLPPHRCQQPPPTSEGQGGRPLWRIPFWETTTLPQLPLHTSHVSLLGPRLRPLGTVLWL